MKTVVVAFVDSDGIEGYSVTFAIGQYAPWTTNSIDDERDPLLLSQPPFKPHRDR
jgi:hypothetical protein